MLEFLMLLKFFLDRGVVMNDLIFLFLFHFLLLLNVLIVHALVFWNFWSIELNVQSSNFIEGVSHKTRRQIEEFERLSGVESNALTVDGVPVDSYLTRLVLQSIEILMWIWDLGFGVISDFLRLCFGSVILGLFGMKQNTQQCLL